MRVAVGGVLVSVAVAVALIVSGSAPPPGVANVWVSTDPGTCDLIVTAGAYDQSKSCASVNAALTELGGAGGLVGVKGGIYGDETLTADQSATAVVFGADGENVLMGNIVAQADNVEIRRGAATSFKMYGVLVNSLEHFTVRDIVMTGDENSGGLFLEGTIDDVKMIGGSIGPWVSEGRAGPLVLQYPGPITNVLIDNVTFHDISRNPDSDHLEVIRIDGGSSDVTIRNNTFRDIDVNTSTIFWTNAEPGALDETDPRDITIEGNLFGSPGAAFFHIVSQLPVIETCENIRIAYNTFSSTQAAADGLQCETYTNTEWVGNVGIKPSGNCNGTYLFNVWQHNVDTACDPTDTMLLGPSYSVSLLGIGGYDGFRLEPGSPARGAGDPSDCPALDAEGRDRPLPADTVCDAGGIEAK